jgi:anhydro-N-acetylmuramic acid kinase
MDYWANKHKGTAYDQNGDWANSGEVNIDLLDTLLNDTYFALPAPKSTGREHFNSQWIEYHLRNKKIPANNIQTTLLQLTARSISQAIKSLDNSIDDVFICGGGALNQTLMNTLKDQLNTTTVDSTDSLGIAPEWVEAAAFAWLAHQTLNGLSGNIPQATGAKEACVLGAIHSA